MIANSDGNSDAGGVRRTVSETQTEKATGFDGFLNFRREMLPSERSTIIPTESVGIRQLSVFLSEISAGQNFKKFLKKFKRNFFKKFQRHFRRNIASDF